MERRLGIMQSSANNSFDGAKVKRQSNQEIQQTNSLQQNGSKNEISLFVKFVRRKRTSKYTGAFHMIFIVVKCQLLWLKLKSKTASCLVYNCLIHIGSKVFSSVHDIDLVNVLVAGVVEIFRYVIMVITSFNPEVERFLSKFELPESVFIICKTFLALSIINKHISFCILATIWLNY